MDISLSRPVTIHAARHDARWFPDLLRHRNGDLLLYVQCGHDMFFAPWAKWRSRDGGRSWHEEEIGAPAPHFVHCPRRGQTTLYEMDYYGFLEPERPDTYRYYSAWSTPDTPLSRGQARVHAPSIAPVPLSEFPAVRYPHHLWWPIINALHPPGAVPENIKLGGPFFSDMIEQQNRWLAVAHGLSRHARRGQYSVWLFESRDEGKNWRELSLVADGAALGNEGFNEATLTALGDGRLHSVIRSGDVLHQSWSSDEGRSWSTPTPLRPMDGSPEPRMAWPRVAQLEDGMLLLAYGRPGKHLLFDPTGSGQAWRGRLDLHAWEMSTQELMGVPADLRLHGDTSVGTRYWDSGDYLSVVPVGAREVLVTYDVQSFYEHWNALPISGVRMVRVTLR